MNETHALALTLGTRGSALALYQADATQALLSQAFPQMEIRREIIKTTGDRRTDVSLAQVAKVEGIFDKGVFIKELETALASGGIDLAVHSLKDVPTVLDERFALAAVLERAAVRDVLVCREPATLASLQDGCRVGTSSVRRARQVAHLRPGLTVVDLRGNVPTRLQKLADATHHDAILLAEAGLVRLGFLPEIPPHEGPEPVLGMDGLFALRLPEDEFFPAAGQGAIAMEIRAGDEVARSLAQAICHAETWQCITAEREFLRLLDAGCHTPVGVFSFLIGEQLHMRARVFPEGGGPPLTSEAVGTDPMDVAKALFESLS